MKSLIQTFLAILVFSSHCLLAQPNQALTDACKAGDLAAVKKVVDGGADVNALRADGVPVMAEANLWPEITQYLIDKGADPNGGTYSALMIAANNYSFETMEVLLKNGADPNKGKTTSQLHPIAQLIVNEKAKPKPNKKVIKMFEEQLETAGGNMEPVTSNISPLENTINQTNCVECLALLLKYKADPNQKDQVGNDMLTNSIIRDSDLGENFTKYGGMLENNWGYKLPNWFYTRVKEGSSADEVKALVKAGADVNYLNPVNGNTPLMAAIGAKNTEAAKFLISNGADVNFTTPTKKNALSLSAAIGDVELLQMLVEKGADVNVETWELNEASGQYAKGFTALTIAVMNDHVDAARYLIEAGCKPKEGVSGLQVNRSTNCMYQLKNKTAIYYAVENNNMEMIKMLTDNFKMWNMHEMLMKQPEKSYDVGVLEITTCFKIKTPLSPSLYAKKLEYKDIQKYLMSKGL